MEYNAGNINEALEANARGVAGLKETEYLSSDGNHVFYDRDLFTRQEQMIRSGSWEKFPE